MKLIIAVMLLATVGCRPAQQPLHEEAFNDCIAARLVDCLTYEHTHPGFCAEEATRTCCSEEKRWHNTWNIGVSDKARRCKTSWSGEQE